MRRKTLATRKLGAAAVTLSQWCGGPRPCYCVSASHPRTGEGWTGLFRTLAGARRAYAAATLDARSSRGHE